MVKVTFMGAGSTVFAKNVLGDCLVSPDLKGMEIALYDIDAERLDDSLAMLKAINRQYRSKATIKTYLGVRNRKKALAGADFVVNAIQVGGYDPCTITDFEIPKKYGLRQTIADTLGLEAFSEPAVHSGGARFFEGYGRGLPESPVYQLHESDGHDYRRHPEGVADQIRRTVPQRTALRRAPAFQCGHGIR